MANCGVRMRDLGKVLKTIIPLFGAAAIAAFLFYRLHPQELFDDGAHVDSWSNVFNAHNWGSVGGLGLRGESAHHILLFASVFFVLVNTVYFFFDLMDAAEKYGRAPAVRRPLRVAMGLTIVSIVVIIFWGVAIVTLERSFLEAFPPFGHHWHDVVAIVVFGLFLLIDGLLMKTADSRSKFLKEGIQEYNDTLGRTADRHTSETLLGLQKAQVSLPIESLSSKAQFWLVDLPVLVGLATVLVLLSVFEDTRVMHEYTIFSDGFAAGAVAMHVVSSQVIFVLLSIWSQKEIRAEIRKASL